MSYHEMVRILYSMHYIGNNITEHEKLLIDNIFRSTCSSGQTSLWLKNLFTFLLAIHNISSKEKFVCSEEYQSLKEPPTTTEGEPGINIKYNVREAEEKMDVYGYFEEKGRFGFQSGNEVKAVSSVFKIFLDNCKLNAP